MFSFDSWIDVALYIIEILGVISFASSGAITAIRKKTDFLGIWILTLIAIFGGGILRDLILVRTPHIFYDPEYLLLAGIGLIVATVWFIIAYNKKTAQIIDSHRHDLWIYFLDAVGIGVFCVMGVQEAYHNMPTTDIDIVGQYVFITVLGVITGVCGGMFRDVFIGQIPMVFRKHFYMTPCIIGSFIYALLYTNNFNQIASIIICVGIIVLLRSLASVYKWNLPLAKGYNELLDAKNEENKVK